jgi:hypothetical protein
MEGGRETRRRGRKRRRGSRPGVHPGSNGGPGRMATLSRERSKATSPVAIPPFLSGCGHDMVAIAVLVEGCVHPGTAVRRVGCSKYVPGRSGETSVGPTPAQTRHSPGCNTVVQGRIPYGKSGSRTMQTEARSTEYCTERYGKNCMTR